MRPISEHSIEVHKFGGGCLVSQADYAKAAIILRGRMMSGQQVVAVVSARNKLTDRLINLIDTAAHKKVAWKEISRELDEIKSDHASLSNPEAQVGYQADFARVFGRMENTLKSVRRSGKYTPAQYASFLSSGEELSSLVLGTHLPECQVYPAEEVISTRGPYITASADIGRSKEPPVNSIIGGFYGRTRFPFTGKLPVAGKYFGSRKILGRGGTDLTAIVVAKKIDARRKGANVHLFYWKNDPLSSADPKLVQSAKPLSEVPIDVGLEAAAHGAKIFHPDAIAQGKELAGRIFVKNFSNPGEHGAVLAQPSSMSDATIIAGEPGWAKVEVSGPGFLGNPGIVHALAGSLGKNHVSVDLVNTSPLSLSFSILESDAGKARKALEHTVKGLNRKYSASSGGDFELNVKTGQALVGLMRRNVQEPHVRTGVSTALEDLEIKPAMESTGGSSISLIVDEGKMAPLIRKLHQNIAEKP